MLKKENIFQKVPDKLPSELFDTLLQNDAFTLERIISKGHCTPGGQWYDQEKDEWVIVLQGAATLRLEDRQEPIFLQPGDHVLLKAHVRHRVEWTEPDRETIWLALHF